MRKLFIVAAIVSAGLFSCSSSQEIILGLNEDAELSVAIDLDEFLFAYLSDLGSARGSGRIFDPAAVEAGLANLGAEVLSVEIPDERSLRIRLRADDPERTAAETVGSADLIGWETIGTTSVLRITLTPDNIRLLLGATALVDEDGIAYLLPGDGAQAQAYREDLIWIFEEYEPEGFAPALLDSARIEIDIVAPRNIRSADGTGVQTVSADRVRVTIGVLDVLTLREPREYRIEY